MGVKNQIRNIDTEQALLFAIFFGKPLLEDMNSVIESRYALQTNFYGIGELLRIKSCADKLRKLFLEKLVFSAAFVGMMIATRPKVQEDNHE